jgi:hypothetical protein
MRKRTFARFAWAPVALGALVCGCNYFRPADPEPPKQGTFTPSYIDPDATLQTIADAVADKARTIGITAYTAAFAESTAATTPAYHQFFWPTDAAAWVNSGHTVPADWNSTLERNFYVRFVNLRGDGYEVEWTRDEANPDNVQGDVASIHRHYVVRTLAEDLSITSTLAIGYADLTMALLEGNWRITRWNDRIDPAADPNDAEQITLGRRRLNTTQ